MANHTYMCLLNVLFHIYSTIHCVGCYNNLYSSGTVVLMICTGATGALVRSGMMIGEEAQDAFFIFNYSRRCAVGLRSGILSSFKSTLHTMSWLILLYAQKCCHAGVGLGFSSEGKLQCYSTQTSGDHVLSNLWQVFGKEPHMRMKWPHSLYTVLWLDLYTVTSIYIAISNVVK